MPVKDGIICFIHNKVLKGTREFLIKYIERSIVFFFKKEMEFPQNNENFFEFHNLTLILPLRTINKVILGYNLRISFT